MKIAYIIMAHNQVEQLLRLIDRLNNKSCYFVIHYDKNGKNNDFDKLRKSLSKHNNVYFTKRTKCYWGDFSLVQATVDSVKLLLDDNKLFDYAILLSGQDYPIVNNHKIESFLEKNRGKQYIQNFKSEDVWKNSNRTKYYYFNKYNYQRKQTLMNYLVNRFQTTLRSLNITRNSQYFKEIYGGSQWWCLSKDCLQFIITFIDENKKVVSFFKYTHIPDEMFFQTILMNSPYQSQIVNDHLRYIDWSADPAPKTLSKEDFQMLAESDKLFARKFDEDSDRAVLDMIDKLLIYDKL